MFTVSTSHAIKWYHLNRPIRSVIQQYPEIHEDEIQECIQFTLGKKIHVSTIAKLLKKMSFTRRKVHIIRLILEKEEQ